MAIGDYFLKIDGIEGESQDKTHKSEIEIESFSWGATNAGTSVHGTGAGGGKVQMQDFHFTMTVNKASPKLMLACATGDHIKSAILTLRKAGKDQQEFQKVTFTDVFISSYQSAASAHGSIVPTDQISLNFTKIEFEYKAQTEKGTLGGAVKAFYDMKQQVHG